MRRDRIEVKVEANFVMRGTVYPVRQASFTPAARDLFDVMELYSNEGITPGIRRAFVVYLACGKRPIHALLFPQLRDIRHDFTHNFQGMTAAPVTLDALLATRERLVQQIQRELDDDERRFLLSLVGCDPEWSPLGIAHLENLPGVRWKLRNLEQLQKNNARKFAEQAEALVAGFDGIASVEDIDLMTAELQLAAVAPKSGRTLYVNRRGGPRPKRRSVAVAKPSLGGGYILCDT